MKQRLPFLLAACWFALPGVTAFRGVAADAPESLATQAKAILQAHCAGCHGGGKASKGGFGFALDRDQLVSRRLVLPGKAGQSDLFLRIEHGEMPPPARKQRPSQAELTVLKRWIDAGAPAFDRPSQAKAVPESQVPGLILADLEQLDPRRRRFTRYLTLTHLAFAKRPERELKTTQEAAAKLLNSLSWQPRLSMPEPLAVETILRIDLRAYKWTAALWEKLVFSYPYRFYAETPEARAIAKHTGTEGAALRADWFVATASRPPLYHDLLQLPATDRALERLLQVDVPGNLQDDNLLRSGFNDSGVSKNNRLIERHDAVHGALWRSHDFEKNTGRQNLFEHPLGPNAGATSFQPAGGEIIFHLPNGLHGYMLVDAQGRRIDKAPGEIVSDPRRPDQRVETGISCMSCHARGLLFKADQLRAHVEKNAQVFGPQVLAAVRAIHPRKAQLQTQVDEDNVRYLKALEKLGVRDPDDEPINLVTRRFEATLDGATAAAELGMPLDDFGRFLKQDASLARIFGGLLVPGGTGQREVFQENFPAMARRLVATGVPPVASSAALASFHGHTATVNCVAFSPDGKLAASGSNDKTIRVWDAATGTEVAVLHAQTEVYCLSFSPDGKQVLGGGADRLLRLWDWRAKKEVRRFEGHTAAIRCVSISPDNILALSGGDDRTVRVWHLPSGDEAAGLTGHTAAITSVLWLEKGQSALSAGVDGTIRGWDTLRRRPTILLEGHAGPVLCLALAPGGKVLSGGNDKTIRLWDLNQRQELLCFKGHANAVIHVQVPPQGDAFWSSSSQHKNPDRSWRRWDLKQRTVIGSKSLGAEASFGCAAFSPDGRYILVGGPGGFLRRWEW